MKFLGRCLEVIKKLPLWLVYVISFIALMLISMNCFNHSHVLSACVGFFLAGFFLNLAVTVRRISLLTEIIQLQENVLEEMRSQIRADDDIFQTLIAKGMFKPETAVNEVPDIEKN